MANTFYYGSSTTPADNPVKQVVIHGLSTDIRDDSFLQVGDTITVTFTYGNTAESPTMKLFNGSVDQEKAITGDNGHFIKAQNLDQSLVNMWRAGLTCGFCYVEIGGSSYWVLTNSEIATATDFGRVKITNSIEGVTDKENTAISVVAAEEIIQSRPVSTLAYQGLGENENTTLMGTLTYTNSIGAQQEPIPLYAPELTLSITNTSELHNDGEDGSYPFLTANIPTALTFTSDDNGLVFYDSESDESYPMYEPVDENGNTYIQSLNNLEVFVPQDININTNNNCNLESGNLVLNENMYFNLDLELNEDEDEVIGGADRDLYLALRALDWDLDFL